jgi:uncharacterized lipoprotein YmbA
MKRLSIRLAAVALALLPSCGFLQPRPDNSRLFVLATVEELDDTRTPAPPSELALGLGPLTLPDYVQRRELVTRHGATGLESSRSERWAEPLDAAVARVLSHDLRFVTGARVVAHPWFERDAPDTRVRIRFERFELEERERAVLTASWRLEDKSGAVLHERQSRIVRSLPDSSGASAALELSRALAELSEEIAEAWTQARAG